MFGKKLTGTVERLAAANEVIKMKDGTTSLLQKVKMKLSIVAIDPGAVKDYSASIASMLYIVEEGLYSFKTIDFGNFGSVKINIEGADFSCIIENLIVKNDSGILVFKFSLSLYGDNIDDLMSSHNTRVDVVFDEPDQKSLLVEEDM